MKPVGTRVALALNERDQADAPDREQHQGAEDEPGAELWGRFDLR